MLRLVQEALRAVGTVVTESLVGSALAVTNALVYSLGFFWTGKSPAHQTRAEFIAAHMAYLHFFFSVSIALGYSIPLGKHRWIKQPEREASQLFWFGRLLQRGHWHLVVSGAIIFGISIASGRLSERWRPYLVHFYPSALFVQYFMAALSVTARTVYRTETVEGTTRPPTSSAPHWKRIWKAYFVNIGFLASVYVASMYIHLSSRLKLEDQNTFVVFSVSSLLFRMLIMKMLFWAVGRKQKIHVRVLYVVTAVPTVMIGTQVRIALLRVTGNVSTTSVVVLALIEPLFRILKIWRVRREVERKPVATTVITPFVVHPKRSQPSGASHRVVSQKRTGHRSFRQHRPSRLGSGMPAQLLLQFTAAEIHADMCSEYIAIGCSLAIFYFLEGHPRYSWPVQQNINRLQRLELVLLQVAVELAVDTLCCLCEVANGIPLRTSPELKRFLMGLFVGCAVTNIGVTCSIYIK